MYIGLYIIRTFVHLSVLCFYNGTHNYFIEHSIHLKMVKFRRNALYKISSAFLTGFYDILLTDVEKKYTHTHTEEREDKQTYKKLIIKKTTCMILY